VGKGDRGFKTFSSKLKKIRKVVIEKGGLMKTLQEEVKMGVIILSQDFPRSLSFLSQGILQEKAI
jgi:hypothetical protein